MVSLRMMFWTFIGSLISRGEHIFPIEDGYCFTKLSLDHGKVIISIFVETVKEQTVDLKITSQYGYLPITDEVRFVQDNITTNKRFLIPFVNTKEGVYHICFKIIPQSCKKPKSARCDIKYIDDEEEVENIFQSIFDLGMDER